MAFKSSNLVNVLIFAYFMAIVFCSKYDDELSQNYEQMLESGNFSDVRLLVGSEQKEFCLHKNILYARCPAIGAMFEAVKLPESQVIIRDESPEVFEQFIKFVYTGAVKLVKHYAKELLILADKYQMDSLKYHCTQELLNLTSKSVISTLVLADLYNVTELKPKCVDFICENAEEVMSSEDWKQLKDRPDLLLELFENRVKKYPKRRSWG